MTVKNLKKSRMKSQKLIIETSENDNLKPLQHEDLKLLKYDG